MANPCTDAIVDPSKTILYDLTIQAEWPLEPETVLRGREKSLDGRPASTYRSAWGMLRNAGLPLRSGSACLLPTRLEALISTQLSWQVALSSDGSNIGILQEQTIEIRTSHDEFSSIIGRCGVAADANPQWRHLVWSTDSTILAYACSDGHVTLIDMLGMVICSIDRTTKSGVPADVGLAVSSLIFKQSLTQPKGCLDLLVITYAGVLHNYVISVDEGTVQLVSTFSFADSLPMPCVSCAVYHPEHSLLLVGSVSDVLSVGRASAEELGVSAWRVLAGEPYYKRVTDYEAELNATTGKRRQWMRRLQSRIRGYHWNSEQQDGVYKMCLSPDGKLLSAVHFSGQFSLFEVPSLRVQHTWPLNLQPNFDEVNAEIAENPKKRKQMKEHLKAFFLNDTSWWSDQSVILSRGNGAVSVCSVSSLNNQLGLSPEWFEPCPSLTMAHHSGFLALECECKYGPLKRRLSDDAGYHDDDDDDEDGQTLFASAMSNVSRMLYYVTDSDRFQPPRKRQKLVTRTYRLVSLNSTTPEQLYTRKIEHEEYGEALQLARCYQLDCDRVYQKQWRSVPVSVTSIHDYLGKICKRSWVLHECMERVPTSCNTMRELLEFGLRGTQLPAITAHAVSCDRFLLCDPDNVEEEEDFDADVSEETLKKAHQLQQMKLLAQIDFNNLLLTQQELCRIRLKLLQYLDRLSTYEEILGGIHVSEDRYDPDFFQTFRSQNIVEAAIDYARASDWRAVDVIFTYHGEETLEHRLSILSNFPETFSPFEYRSLLPEISGGLDGSVVEWQCEHWRQADWCEQTHVRERILTETENAGEYLYRDRPQWTQFRGATLSPDQLTVWYLYQACEIEAMSCQVDCALELINRGIERDVQGLQCLHEDLVVMETLVYDCHVDDTLTLKDLREMSHINRIHLMMSTSSDEMYIKNIRRWLLPYLNRIEAQSAGNLQQLLASYLIQVATTDLARCLQVFQASKADQSEPLITQETFLLSVALKCVYSYDGCDQLNNAFGILECLPQRAFSVVSTESSELHDQVDQLESHLSAAEILQNHDIPQSVAFIRHTKDNAEEANRLLIKMTRLAGRKVPALNPFQWKALLSDLLLLQEKVYDCIEPDICYQIFVASLLTSSEPVNIALAGEMINPADGANSTPMSREMAIQLVLSAAHEYFDSSANLMDPCMELARSCLLLVRDCPASIQDELDLIKALSLLDGFGVSVLPIQVRMCKDRLSLIERAVNSKPYTYRNSQRLLQLSELLRIGTTTSDRKGHVLRIVTQAALQANDHQVAYQTCTRLICQGYAAIWSECVSLAENQNFTDISAKVELLSFAVSHCTPDMIGPVLRAKCLLETQVLYDSANRDMTQQRDSVSPDTSGGSTSPTEKTFSVALDALRLTSEFLSAKSLLSSATWQQHHQTLASRWKQWTGGLEGDSKSCGNDGLQRQACHPFYEGVIDKAHINKNEVDYSSCDWSQGGEEGLNGVLLRAGKLEEMLTEGNVSQPSSEVLLSLSKEAMTRDCSLALAYLLALPQPLDAGLCFDTLPTSEISLQLASYYYSLCVYAAQPRPTNPPRPDPVYQHDPTHLVRRARLAVSRSLECKHAEMVQSLTERIEQCEERLVDFTQARIVGQLDRGIDVERFSTDADYRHETILGLAMCLEQPVVEIARCLADRYNISLYDVNITHLEYLFDSELTTAELEQRLQQADLVASLTCEPDRLTHGVCERVLPSMSGVDHSRLVVCFGFLEKAGSGLVKGITPQAHGKLLKRIKAIAPELNYTKLLSGDECPLSVIQPILTADNVNALSKLASKIPDQSGGFLQASVVYCAWAIHLFWFGELQDKQTPLDWIHRFESCSEHMQKLLPEDLIQFSDAITFVADSAHLLSLDTRCELVRRMLKYSRQTSGKRKKREQTTVVSWETVSNHLQYSLSHLNALSNPTVVSLRESDIPKHRQYALLFDLSRSQPEKVHTLLTCMLLNGESLQLVSDLLLVSRVTEWTGQQLVSDAIRDVTQVLRDNRDMMKVFDEQEEPLTLLINVIEQVSAHQASGGHVASCEDVMKLLRVFCADDTVSDQTRLQVLLIVEQLFDLAPSDLVLLTLYRTQALVLPNWQHLEALDAERINSDAERQKLFIELLEGSTELSQFNALFEILKVWPALHLASEAISTGPPCETHAWCCLMRAVVVSTDGQSATGGQLVISIVTHLQHMATLSQQCLCDVVHLLVSHELDCSAATCLLLSEHADLHKLATEQLNKHTQNIGDAALFELIVKRHLVPDIISSVYYVPVVNHLLSTRSTDVPEVATQLRSSGHDLEAGSLLLRHAELQPVLRTFDAAIGVVTRWLTF